MCFRLVSLRLANTGANWSFWNWILSNAFLTLVSGLYLLYSHFLLFQPGVTQLGMQFVWAAGWLSSACGACLLAGSWQVISRIPALQGNRKGCYCILWKKGWYQTDVCMVLSLCGSARTQNWAHSCTVRHCHGLQLHIGSWADTVLEGRGKGYWVGKAWNRWHRAQSL